jgi:hypothetical protein
LYRQIIVWCSHSVEQIWNGKEPREQFLSKRWGLKRSPSAILEGAREGYTVADWITCGMALLIRDEVMESIPDMIHEVSDRA